MSKIAKIGLVILVLILIIIFIVVYFNNRNKNQTPAQTTPTETEKKDLSNIDPQQYSTLLGVNGTNFTKAQTQALVWKKTAQFVFLKVQIPENLNPKQVTETYVFDSADSPLMYWTIGYDLDGNSIRALIYKADFLQDETLKKINTQYWQTDWLTSFQKADKAGGKEFRDKYKDDLDITANLTYDQTTSFLSWVITYTSISTKDTKTIKVNANTGEIIKEEQPQNNQENNQNTQT